jgi:hypothetical protein
MLFLLLKGPGSDVIHLLARTGELLSESRRSASGELYMRLFFRRDTAFLKNWHRLLGYRICIICILADSDIPSPATPAAYSVFLTKTAIFLFAVSLSLSKILHSGLVVKGNTRRSDFEVV